LSTISFGHPEKLPYFPIGETGFSWPDFAGFLHELPLVVPVLAGLPVDKK
jgi:hypothetical protein